MSSQIHEKTTQFINTEITYLCKLFPNRKGPWKLLKSIFNGKYQGTRR